MPITINGSGTVTGISAGGLPAGTVTEATLSTSAVQLIAPPGAIAFVCQSNAPTGWLKANGAAVSRSTFSTLFATIGTTFGSGDGSTTFNLPDLRGEFPRGWDDSRGIDAGRGLGTAQSGQNLSHSHGVTDPGHDHGFDNDVAQSAQGTQNAAAGSGAFPNLGFVGKNDRTKGTDSRTTSISINNDGGTESRPRNIALLAIIKF